MQRPCCMYVLSQLKTRQTFSVEFKAHSLLEQSETEEVVRQTPDDIVAPHVSMQDEPVISDEELEAEGAGYIL